MNSCDIGTCRLVVRSMIQSCNQYDGAVHSSWDHSAHHEVPYEQQHRHDESDITHVLAVRQAGSSHALHLLEAAV